MIGKLFSFLRPKPAVITGTGKLPEGESRVVDIGDPLAGGLQVVLCRVEGKLHALDSACPHEGGRIVGGPLQHGRFAICPLHNYLFDPVDGRVETGVCKKAKVYRVRETAEGDCEIWL